MKLKNILPIVVIFFFVFSGYGNAEPSGREMQKLAYSVGVVDGISGFSFDFNKTMKEDTFICMLLDVASDDERSCYERSKDFSVVTKTMGILGLVNDQTVMKAARDYVFRCGSKALDDSCDLIDSQYKSGAAHGFTELLRPLRFWTSMYDIKKMHDECYDYILSFFEKYPQGDRN